MNHRHRILPVLLVALASPAAAQTPECAAPNVLIVLDVSGSMGKAEPGTKYTQAAEAIASFTAPLDQSVRFGLLLFPRPDGVGCDMSADVQVPLAVGNAQTIADLLLPGGASFWGGPTALHDTPMVQALGLAGGIGALQDAARRSYVVLVTDGVQDCCKSGDYDSEPDCLPGSTTLDPVEAAENVQDLVARVTALANKKVHTFVVGFGSAVDAAALNQLSKAGFTAQPGCNVAQTDPTAQDNCFYNASNGAAISAALADIVAVVSEESCDGLDNDCDGQTDELWPSLGTSCDGPDADQCATGVTVCALQGDGTECLEPGAGAAEVCNGKDDDCDGLTDELWPDLGTACDGPDADLCKSGTVVCAASGNGTVCQESGPGKSETCNGKDDDCDGQVDELWPDRGKPCDGPDPDTCATGTLVCNAAGNGLVCDEVAGTSVELCNGVDDDCDGLTDEDWPDFGKPCDGADLDLCLDGVLLCAPDHSGLVCAEEPEDSTETCNGKDDDCDGETDEGEVCPAGQVCSAGTCIPQGTDTPGDAGPTAPDAQDQGNPDPADAGGTDRPGDPDGGAVPDAGDRGRAGDEDAGSFGALSDGAGAPSAGGAVDTATTAGSGCGCRTTPAGGSSGGPVVVVMALALWGWRRRRSRRLAA